MRASQEPAPECEEPVRTLSASMNDAQWLEFMIRSAEAQQADGVMLPAIPSPAWQMGSVGSTNADAMREAAVFQQLVDQQLTSIDRTVCAADRVLDFGCGWGRHIRLWMRRIPPDHLFGVDVDADMIGFCRVSGLPAQFAVVPPDGPAPLASGGFDLIYAYSVFSHLSESVHLKWIREFRRILRPGGIVIFTTQPRRFIVWTESIRARRHEDLSNWESSLRTAFSDIREALQDYDAGRFVFAPTGGGENRPSSFYGEAAAPEAWLRENWEAEGFSFLAFIDDANRCPQACAVMQSGKAMHTSSFHNT
jgi:SAM-dependent methyltransferase